MGNAGRQDAERQAAERVEEFLRAERASNVARAILPRDNNVFDRLLAASVAMREVYVEILSKLPDEEDWRTVVAEIVNVAGHWTPDRMRDARQSALRVRELNEELARTANRLADLLEEREDECASASLQGHDDIGLYDWLCRAADECGDPRRYLFAEWVKPQLQALHARFDWKYWPTDSEVLRAAAQFAKDARVIPADNLTASAIASRESSHLDFLRALLSALRNLNDFALSRPFHFSDQSLALIINNALGLGDNEVDAAQVKSARHRFK